MTDGVNLTTDAIAAMTSAEAGQALATMHEASNPTPPLQPVDAQDAKGRLDLLSRDPSWAKALFNGDVAARAQFDKLNKMVADADVVGDALAGIQEPPQLIETTMDGQLPTSVVRAVVDDMRASGISDGAIAETLEWRPVSAREYAATQALQASKFGDAEWVKRLMASDWAATKEWKLMCSILSRPIAELK